MIGCGSLICFGTTILFAFQRARSASSWKSLGSFRAVGAGVGEIVSSPGVAHDGNGSGGFALFWRLGLSAQ